MKQLDDNKVYSLNPDYLLRHDLYRTFILSYNKLNNDSSESWMSIIHPMQAKILSFFTHGKIFKEVIKDLSNFLCLGEKELIEIIEPYIENTEEFHTELGDEKFNFPKNLIIQTPNAAKEYFVDQFDWERTDFRTQRLYTGPSSITLMLTNRCTTKCVYCYADIEHKVEKHINLEQIKAIIEECDQMNCNAVDIIGGEVMLFSEWKEVVEILIRHNFFPEVISTKIPVKEEDIIFLKHKGIDFLQISLDTASDSIIKHTLKRYDNYLEKMKKTFEYCDRYKLSVQIASTLTKYTIEFLEIKKLLDFINKYSCIQNIDFGPAFYSIYKQKGKNFDVWGISREEYLQIIEKVRQIEKNYHFKINFDYAPIEKKFYNDIGGSHYFQGARCSANIDHLFILPDGKATICEQLYWTDNFIVGDINQQTIKEIWSSEKSLYLANLKQEDIPEDSACASCKFFEQCHKDVNKCWADIIKAYGKDKWYYPDPRCIYAPKTFNNIAFDNPFEIKINALISKK